MARKWHLFLSRVECFLRRGIRGQGSGVRGQGSGIRAAIAYLLLFTFSFGSIVGSSALLGAIATTPNPATTSLSSPSSLFSPSSPSSLPSLSSAQNSPLITQNSPSDLIQQGIQRYQAEQFTEAAQILQQVVDTAGTNSLNRAQALNYLALTYHKLGEQAKATAAIANSLSILQPLVSGNSVEVLPILAQALSTQGQLKLAAGDPETALKIWQQATALYQKLGNATGVIGSTINQAQALQAMGLYPQAIQRLASLDQSLQAQPDSLLKVTALRSYGNAQRVAGELQASRRALEQALAIARKLNAKQAEAEVLLSLGNTMQAQQSGDPDETEKLMQAALQDYQQAAQISNAPSTKVQAQLNLFNLLLNDATQWSAAQKLLPELQGQLNRLSPSRATVYAKVNLVQSLIRPREKLDDSGSTSEGPTTVVPALTPGFPTWQEVAQMAATAGQQAQSLGDKRAQAYALGTLGELYEQTNQRQAAQDLTQQALLLSQSIKATDVSYRWHWQTGRLLEADGNLLGAIAAYREAITALKALRSDLVTMNPEVQFSFRDSVEPIYRGFVRLLLQAEDAQKQKSNQPEAKKAVLQEARAAIESLQLAELENFFRQACLEGSSVQIDQVDRSAAVIYPIILKDRLEVIVSLPNQPLDSYSQPISEQELKSTLQDLRKKLTFKGARVFHKSSEQVYNWLIRPLEAKLTADGVKVLVFVLDGPMRSVPMAALYDGKQYLVEKYGIALAPGLQLLDMKPLKREQLKALIGGLTESRQGLPELPAVQGEVNSIQTEAKISSEVLMNKDFTRANLKTELKSFKGSIVHLATHGEFSSNKDNTYLLAWDNKIKLNELSELLKRDRQTPIELLVLSACKTAVGDSRAALGLAGVAIQAGARSTMGSLWYVDDTATAALMTQFYRTLTNPEVSKAEALRQAQLTLIKNSDPADPLFYRSHPYYWASLVLVGNWL